MKAPNYQVDLIKDVRPSTADVSGLAQATAAEMATSGQVSANMLRLAGGTIWDAYKGKTLADFEKETEAERVGFVSAVKEAGQGLLSAEEQKKQGLVFAAQASQQLLDESMASDLEGRDPALIEKQAAQMFAQNKSSVLQEYEKKIKKYGEVLSSFPAKQDEMMARSEALLKQYIARMPGMADQFREASQRILGVKGIEQFTTMRAYRAVENFANQQAQAAQEAAKIRAREEDDAMKYFIEGFKGAGLGDANTAFEAWKNPETKQEYTAIMRDLSATQREITIKKRQWEAGQIATSEYVSGSLAASTMVAAASLPILKQELFKAGLTEADIKGGNLTFEQLRNPAIQAAIQKYSSQALAFANSQAETLKANLSQQVASGTIKIPEKDLSEAYKAIDTWRDNFIQNNVGANGQGLFNALSGISNAPEKSIRMIRENTEIMKNFLSIVDPEGKIYKQLPSITPEAFKQLEKVYPQARVVLELMQSMTKASGNPAEFISFITDFQKKIGTVGAMDISKNSTPGNKATNPEAVAMSVIKYEASARTVKQAAANANAPIDADVVSSIKTIINGAAADTDFGSVFFKNNLKEIQDVIKRASPADQEIIKQHVLTASNNSIYGFKGHGEALDSFMKSLKDAKPTSATFADPTGTNVLQFTAVPRQPEKAPTDKRQTPEMLNEQTMTRAYDFHAVKKAEQKINAALAQVDNALRVRAQLNGESLIKLRQDFIKTVNTAMSTGKPLATVVMESFQDAVKAPAGSVTPSTPAASSRRASMAEITKFARENNVDVDTAIEQLKSSGYSVE